MDKWTDSSTFGVLGCFFFFLALLLLAVWIALPQVMRDVREPEDLHGRAARRRNL